MRAASDAARAEHDRLATYIDVITAKYHAAEFDLAQLKANGCQNEDEYKNRIHQLEAAARAFRTDMTAQSEGQVDDFKSELANMMRSLGEARTSRYEAVTLVEQAAMMGGSEERRTRLEAEDDTNHARKSLDDLRTQSRTIFEKQTRATTFS